MSSDVLHDALMGWAGTGDTYSFISILLNKLDKEQALQLIPMFLHVDREWIEKHTTVDEVYEAFKETVRLNDWSEILQTMLVLDTIKLDEVIELCQMAKAS